MEAKTFDFYAANRLRIFVSLGLWQYWVWSRGEQEWHLGVREREREWIIPFPKFGNGKGIEKTHSLNSGTGREWTKPFPKFGNGKGMKKSIPKIWEREGNEKNPFPQFGNRKGMKKSIPIIREWESEAFILGNGREREFPLTPALQQIFIIFSFSLVLSKTPLPTNNGFQWILA